MKTENNNTATANPSAPNHCDCNYADNYYGDQVCRPTEAQPQ